MFVTFLINKLFDKSMYNYYILLRKSWNDEVIKQAVFYFITNHIRREFP